ncbi:hypothetical protein [Halorubrum sp. FL23]|uniref:hypothetical protein n=1 Tax=Halorubrum sp. FL23 TaxID=3458704 RepID=UPI004034D98F
MSPTRRALLRSASLGAIAIGGCLGTESRADGSNPAAEQESASGRDGDPTLLKVRNPGGEAVVVDLAVGSDEDGGEGATTDPAPVGREIVTSDERAAELTVAAGVAEEGRARVRSFLDETDYETESVFVARAGIESCYRYRIRSVSWRPGHVEYEYCRELRPPDAECEADRRDAVGLLFRLPAAFDSPLRGSGSSGRSPCRTVETRYDRIDANATVPGSDTALGETDHPGSADGGTGGDGS